MKDMAERVDDEMDDKQERVPADGCEMHPSLKTARKQQDAGPSEKITLCELLKR